MEYFNGQKEIVRILVIGGLFDLPGMKIYTGIDSKFIYPL